MRIWLHCLCLLIIGGITTTAYTAEQIPDKTVVLTFDDSVKSHRTYVAPMLKELGFGATFFISHKWMDDTENFMSWKDIGELHEMGFEIGNHTWTHLDLSMPKTVARLEGETALIDNELANVGVPKPVSFAYPGNAFSPEAFRKLQSLGYKFARRGIPPEVPYGKMIVATAYDPNRHHPLLMPTTGDAYPDWTFDFFLEVLKEAKDGKAAVLQFHGVPDVAHPWVHTDPELFKQCMTYLKEKYYNVIALRELEPYLPETLPQDNMQYARHPDWNEETLEYPLEVVASREDMDEWVANMRLYHHYTWDEIENVLGGYTMLPYMREAVDKQSPTYPTDTVLVKPYPGGRHPRIGFLDGAIDPQRGTKASVFLPWNPKDYIVVDVPEAIWSQHGLTYLAHTHIPTIWDMRHEIIKNLDWTIRNDGGLENHWHLPNGIEFGMTFNPQKNVVEMNLWLKNGTDETLTDLRIQNCIMLKGATQFNAQSNNNKTFDKPTAIVKDDEGHIIATAWEHCDRVWGNENCPCMHSDPQLPDCPPGETVSARGKIWFAGNEEELTAMVNTTPWITTNSE